MSCPVFTASIWLIAVRPIACRSATSCAVESTCSMFSIFEFSATIDSWVEKSKSMNGCKTRRPRMASVSSTSLKCVAHSLAVSFTTAAQWSRSVSNRAISSVSWLFVERLYASSKAVHSVFSSPSSVWNFCSVVSTSAIRALNARRAA